MLACRLIHAGVVLLSLVSLSWADKTARKLHSRKRRSKKGSTQAGIGVDCSVDDGKRYNICLDLVTVELEDAVTAKTCGPRDFFPEILRGLLVDGLLYCIPLDATYVDPDVDRMTVDEGWMLDAYRAKETLEKIIRGDYVEAFSPLATADADATFTSPFGYASSLTFPESAKLLVDDVYINIAADQPAPIAVLTPELASGLVASTILHTTSGSATKGTVEATSDSLGLTCSIDLYFGGPGPAGGPEYLGYRQFKGTKVMYTILLHEMLHCLGLQRSNTESLFGTHTDGVSPIWVGTNGLKQWKNVGCDGPLPMDTESGVHFDPTCIPNDLFGPRLPDEPVFSTLAGGLLQDLGYEDIDFKKLHKFKTKELGGELCGDFCPKASKASKSSRRRQPGRQGNPERGRLLYPLPEDGQADITSTSPSTSPSTIPSSVPTQDDLLALEGATDGEYDVFMKALYDQYIATGPSTDAIVQMLFATEDGRFFEMQGSYKAAIEYAEESGYADVINV